MPHSEILSTIGQTGNVIRWSRFWRIHAVSTKSRLIREAIGDFRPSPLACQREERNNPKDQWSSTVLRTHWFGFSEWCWSSHVTKPSWLCCHLFYTVASVFVVWTEFWVKTSQIRPLIGRGREISQSQSTFFIHKKICWIPHSKYDSRIRVLLQNLILIRPSRSRTTLQNLNLWKIYFSWLVQKDQSPI